MGGVMVAPALRPAPWHQVEAQLVPLKVGVRGTAAVTPLASGIYAVKVTTQHGTSNALPFTLSGMVR
jgi:hypothetical protein